MPIFCRSLLVVVALGVCGEASAQPTSTGVQGILAQSRRINWGRAGVTGGIPTTRTRCTTGSGNAGPLANTSTAAQINTAISGCDANHYVELGSGTFALAAGLTVNQNNITLRGQGPNATFLVFSDGSGCGFTHIPICVGDGGFVSPEDAGTSTLTWTAGYAQGTTAITLTAFASGSTKPQVGWLLHLDQIADSTVAAPGSDTTPEVFVCKTQTVKACIQQEGSEAGHPHGPSSTRPQFQTVTIATISAGASPPWTVTFADPIKLPNWRAGQTPTAWVTDRAPRSGIGIENLSIDASNPANSLFGILFFNATQSWVKNVRSVATATEIASSGNWRHIRLMQSTHITVRDSYLFGRRDQDDYGWSCWYCADNLVENNILQRIGTPFMNEDGTGNVFSYNYTINNCWGPWACSVADPRQWSQGSFYQHAPGTSYLLLEGNDGFGLESENYFGQGLFFTAFRNRFSGYDTGTPSQTVPIFLYAFSRHFNIIGNVLGVSTYHTTYEWVAVTNSDNNTACIHAIYALGWGSNCDTAASDDALVKTTLLRWGNYDTTTNTVRFQSSEVPSGLSLYANLVPRTTALPASFLYASKPAWWPTAQSWPGIGPDITGGDISGVGGYANRNPARRCFEDVLGGAFADTTARPYTGCSWN